MSPEPEHVIEMSEEDERGRVSWFCDCGRGGSADGWVVDTAAEKHIRPGERVIYRRSGAWS